MAGNYSADLAFIDAQLDEMEKIAIAPVSASMGRWVGAGLGTAVGGATGYSRAAPDKKFEGAVKGGIVGGLAGLAGGQAATKAGRIQIKQFGQRQLHGATGYLPGQGWRGQNLKAAPGGTSQEARVKALKGIGWKIPDAHVTDKKKALDNIRDTIAKKRKGEEGFFGGDSLSQRFSETGVGKKWERSDLRGALLNRRIAAQRSQRLLAEEGMTSVPGVAKGYATGRGASGKQLGRVNIAKTNLTAPGLAMGVGLPLAFAAPGVVEGVQQKDWRPAVRGVVDSAGYSLAGGLPIAAAMGVGTGISALAGKVIGGGSGQQPQQPQQPPSTASRYRQVTQQYGQPVGVLARQATQQAGQVGQVVG